MQRVSTTKARVDELEEGEISDDIDHSQSKSKVKDSPKTLPQRYMLPHSNQKHFLKKKKAGAHSTKARPNHTVHGNIKTTKHLHKVHICKNHRSSRNIKSKKHVSGTCKQHSNLKKTTQVTETVPKLKIPSKHLNNIKSSSISGKSSLGNHITGKTHKGHATKVNSEINLDDTVCSPKFKRIAYGGKSVSDNADSSNKFVPYDKNCRSNIVTNKSEKPYATKSYSQIDINSSYEDLLDQYKFIQSELNSLKQQTKCKIDPKQKSSNIKKLNHHVKDQRGTRRRSITGEIGFEEQNKSHSFSPKKPKNATESKCNKDTVSSIKTFECEKKLQNGSRSPQSEDEYDLRQKALASCLKFAPSGDLETSVRNPGNSLKKLGTDINLLKDKDTLSTTTTGSILCSYNPNFSSAYSISQCSDNYTVLDMVLGSDDEQMPMAKNSQNVDNKPHANLSVQNQDDDEFDVELLRAELISSLRRKKEMANANQNVESEKLYTLTTGKITNNGDNHINIINESKQISEEAVSDNNNCVPKQASPEAATVSQNGNYLMANTNGSIAQIFESPVNNSVSHNITTNEIKESHTEYANFKITNEQSNNNQSLFYIEPVVINLGHDSSTEESDVEDYGHTDAALASLERLIENAKNKSNLPNEKNVKKQASVLVSCLSEAQQQEYSKLKEIIAQKESHRVDNKTSHPLLDAFQLIKKKLTLASSTLHKENQMLSMLKIQGNKKMSAFINSQLAVQRLKEQLTAAEKVKNSNKQMMFTSNAQLRTVQLSISKRTTLIEDLRGECTNLGSQIFGPNFSLPASLLAANISPKVKKK